MVENERFNPCTQSGCKGFCCYDRPLMATISERRKLWPHASRVNTMTELNNWPKGVDWVYYTRLRRKPFKSGFVLVNIIGKCPNLEAETGNCLMHEERTYAARNFKIGCEDCIETRREHSLPDLAFPNQAE